MKFIGIEDEEEKAKQLNRKKVIITTVVSIIILTILILICVYAGNKSFRKFVDKYVLMKNVQENKVAFIEVDENETNYINAYDKYICILNKNILKGYNHLGNEEYELKVEISNPIVDKNNRFMVIAEKDKQKIYLIEGKEIIWENDLEGNISKVSVNKNGYVSVILAETAYKSVIETFDISGNKIFKTYLSNSIALDTCISYDNKYLSFAETNTDGTLISTKIKTISIQKAKENPSESIIATVEAPNNSLLIQMKYQDANKLICFYDDSIYLVKDNTNEILMDLKEENKKITFADIQLTNNIFRVVEKSALLNTESTVEIMNISNRKTSRYTVEGVAKEIYCYNDKIALNLGTEVHFIGTNGWLIKKYTSSQDVKNIVIGNDFGAIVYKDKVEIVNL